ncbi:MULTISPECIES: type II toxin-antitoxin system Phd/YefM family antitoxin [unclassified Symbiopectobacterium]|nr:MULTISPECIES: type II toxin-antitoxin system prevent-host-death family antitoxin [unclassified Symbiopectobacterium]MCW2475112.1 type II toxin-antitoxin system prevent-host-death family antitoxin [Candidatus Symbiopectobacterium sp. NZEC151]MCW2482319.1 type II toxin-antitoxin system prevent-host-death family antitoxin [Candidatus Symbiopectobacterium sp. NZEC135]MCW2486712.1 type II toxin-antitoxin system prevent-host-death family antitoxin [Candidatus Symbiopectobacterium sp. NZEC127]
MEKVNIYEAKTNLSKLLNDVVKTGEPFLIARNGKTLVKVVAYTEEKPVRKLGFLKGKGTVPDNFDALNSDEIQDMFEGKYD